MKVLSLFDGISCGQIAFDRLGVKFDGVENVYFTSEIKKIAIKTTMLNYPNTVQIGDITKVHYDEKTNAMYKDCEKNTNNFLLGTLFLHGKPDIIIGGSPCQNFSVANVNNMTGLQGEKSSLFYEYLRLIKEIKPKYWLLENVKMKKSDKKQLDEYLGVEGIEINSRLVSFQNRPRIYWTNIPNLTLPEDKHILFKDNKDTDVDRLEEAKLNINKTTLKMWNNGQDKNSRVFGCGNITNADKCYTVNTSQYRYPNSGLIEYKGFCRRLTRREIEMAQTLPLGYTDNLSYNQMQNVCGDGWTVDVIKHILSFIPEITEWRTDE